MEIEQMTYYRYIKGMYGTYPLLEPLGEGTTSKVYKSEIVKGNMKIPTVIKIIKDSFKNKDPKYQKDSDHSYLFINEAQALYNIKSDNVIKLYDCGTNQIKEEDTEKKVEFLVLEYAKNKDLIEYFSTKQGFGELFGRSIFVQILQGLYDCHSKKIVHRDLKLQNILLDDKFKIKIGDLGFSKQALGHLNTLCGTPAYAPPEMFIKKPYDGFKADIYSLGICLFAIVMGKLPFYPLYTPQKGYYKPYFFLTKNNGQNEDVAKFWEQQERLTGTNPSDEFKDLFLKMVAVFPKDRPTTIDINNHPWIMQQPIVSQVDLQNELSKRKQQRELVDQLRRIQEDDEDEEDIMNNKQAFVYRGDSNEEELFTKECQPYLDKEVFDPNTCIEIKSKKERKINESFILFNKILNQIDKLEKDNHKIDDYGMRNELRFKIDYFENEEENEDSKEEEDFCSFPKEDLEEMEENEEEEEEDVPFLSISVEYNIDTKKDIKFISFSKSLGDPFMFRNKVEDLKQIISTKVE
ncbi:MAG: protein kinase [archaeon]|nr:protein kinase [archaeon]